MPIINEGETGGASNNKNLIYPNVNSCLTITCRYGDGSVYGGHAVLQPNSKQMNINKIIDDIMMLGGQKSHLYLIGDTATWIQNLPRLSRYASLAAIAAAFGLGADEKHTIVNVSGWTNGKSMVQIVFHPATRSCLIASNDGKEVLFPMEW